jgi:hypothetical protein
MGSSHVASMHIRILGERAAGPPPSPERHLVVSRPGELLQLDRLLHRRTTAVSRHL